MRRALIWVSVVLLVVAVGIFVFDDMSTLIDYAETIAGVLLCLSMVATGWKLKKRMKERMERGLGREVDDSELTSITAWMRIPDEAARAGREAEKYDFND